MEDPTKKSTDIASRFLSSTPTNVTSLKHRSAVIAADRLKANSANPWFIPTFEEEQIRLMEEFDEQMRRRKQEFQASQKLQARVKGKNERRNPTKPTRGSGAASPGPAEDVAGYEDVAPVLSAEEKAAADAFEAEQQALRAEFNEDQKKREEDHEAAVKMQAVIDGKSASSAKPGEGGKIVMVLFGPPGAGKGSQAPKILTLPLPSPRNQAPKVLTLPVSLPLPLTLPLSRRPRSSRRSASRSCPPETCCAPRWPPAARWASRPRT